MPRKKETAKERRKRQKEERLAKIAERNNNPIINTDNMPEITEKELKETSKIINRKQDIGYEDYFKEETFFRKEKSELNKMIDSMRTPVILDTPEFLTDSSKEVERREVFGKIEQLLKHRFSLVMIADALETNNYDALDDMIARKDEIYKLVEKYTSEETPKPVRLFSGFKKVVGNEYSRTYSEQEERMKAVVSILGGGKYFKEGQSVEETIIAIEDIIARVIDGPDFNLACQIETEFINYELDRAITILSDLRSRSELAELVEELRTVSRSVEERSHAYSVMDMLITGKKNPRQIIDTDDERGER